MDLLRILIGLAVGGGLAALARDVPLRGIRTVMVVAVAVAAWLALLAWVGRGAAIMFAVAAVTAIGVTWMNAADRRATARTQVPTRR